MILYQFPAIKSPQASKLFPLTTLSSGQARLMEFHSAMELTMIINVRTPECQPGRSSEILLILLIWLRLPASSASVMKSFIVDLFCWLVLNMHEDHEVPHEDLLVVYLWFEGFMLVGSSPLHFSSLHFWYLNKVSAFLMARLVMFLHGRSRTFNLATRSTGLGFESVEILYQELTLWCQIALRKLSRFCSNAAPSFAFAIFERLRNGQRSLPCARYFSHFESKLLSSGHVGAYHTCLKSQRAWLLAVASPLSSSSRFYMQHPTLRKRGSIT